MYYQLAAAVLILLVDRYRLVIDKGKLMRLIMDLNNKCPLHNWQHAKFDLLFIYVCINIEYSLNILHARPFFEGEKS